MWLVSDKDVTARREWVSRVLGVAFTPAPRGAVSYAKLLLAWRDAQRRAASSLTQFGNALLASEEVMRDPRNAVVRKAVEMLPGLVPDFGEDLATHLDAAMSAEARDAATRHLQEAAKTLKQYREKLQSVPALQELGVLAKQAVKMDMTAHADLDAALSMLEQEVAVRVAQ
jgi:hypothetical protein